jgi:hypothetical protein
MTRLIYNAVFSFQIDDLLDIVGISLLTIVNQHTDNEWNR